MPHKKIDCALIFAIEEEFNILLKNKTLLLKDDKYHFFEFTDKNGQKRECVTTYVSEPGSHEAYKFLVEFNKVYKPFIQFVIGISGQISDDLKIGDISVANSVEKYDHNSKQKDGTSKLSGKTINLKFSEELFARLPSKEPDRFMAWQKKSNQELKKYFSEEQIDELLEKNYLRASKAPNYFFGKIAVGESVVDDPDEKKIIQNKDRKILCVDMESYGFADANQDEPNLVIIRAISDTADGKKKDLDNFAGNPDGIRKWALLNAYLLFHDVFLKAINFPTNNKNTPEKIFNSTKLESIDKIIETQGAPVFERYSNLINHLVLRTAPDVNSVNIYQYLAGSLSALKSKSTMVVQGVPGSGKTTFLYTAYKYFQLHGLNCNYINLHNYRADVSFDATEKFMASMNILMKPTNNSYLIIDGIDKFERFFTNTDIKINLYWKELVKIYEVILLGVTIQDYENEEDERSPYYLPEPKLKIELKNFDFDVENIDELITDLLLINNLSPDKVSIIKEFIKNTNLKELDWYTTNLIFKRIGNYNYEKSNSVGKFIFNYSKEFFSKYAEPYTIKEASQLTFKKFIKEERLTQSEYESPLWKLIQRSTSIKQFLISEHLVDKYSNLDEDFEKSISDLKHIYSYKINSYFKDNINRNKKVQEKIFESINKRYLELNLLQKPNVCYIIGRLENDTLEWEGRKFLSTRLEYELTLYNQNSYKEDENQYRQHLLLIRTIFISLVYLGDKPSSTIYLKFLLKDQEWDDLNRGFHLEYYGDKPYDPLKLGLHNDDLDINFPSTYSRLSKRINHVIFNPDKNYYLMVDIELQTITSLAVNRHLQGKLDDEIRMGIISILNNFVENPIKLIRNIEFRPFIDLSIRTLSKKNASIFNILKDVHNLKNVKRSGWNFKKITNGAKIERVVQNSESVPDHVFGAMIIAALFLPDTIENDETYSKTDVIKTLLIHDLAEAFTGDTPSFEKTDAKRKEEDYKMKMIFAAQIIKGFANLEEYADLWENYKSQNTGTAKIAREIDKIEQLYQLILYKNNPNNKISDYASWRSEVISMVDTAAGKNILNSLLLNEEDTI